MGLRVQDRLRKKSEEGESEVGDWFLMAIQGIAQGGQGAGTCQLDLRIHMDSLFGSQETHLKHIHQGCFHGLSPPGQDPAGQGWVSLSGLSSQGKSESPS